MTTTEGNVQAEQTEQNGGPVKIGHDVLDPVLAKIQGFAHEYSRVAAQLAAAEGDKEAAVKAWVESTDDAGAKKLRDQIAQLTARLNDMANKAVAKGELSEAEKAKLSEERDALKGKYRDAQLAARKLAGVLNVSEESVNEALTKIGDPTSKRGRPAGSSGNSGPRASVTVYVKGGEGDNKLDQSFDNLAAASKASKVDLSEIQAAYAKSGDVAVENISQIKEAKTFSVGGFEFKTTPKQRKNAAK